MQVLAVAAAMMVDRDAAVDLEVTEGLAVAVAGPAPSFLAQAVAEAVAAVGRKVNQTANP